MTTELPFRSDRKFSDPVNFPYGFARSGEFTIQQADLLVTHGVAYLQLSEGAQSPISEQEKAFVEFASGERAPRSIHERVWQRYQAKLSRSRQNFSLAQVGNSSDLNLKAGDF